ncbi:MAG: hypothetical protein PHY93_10790 [Bacteriovorax sp.]|nr:hypothetical protein [Bacteriovorax sp.]
MDLIRRNDIPKELASIYFDFHWSQKKLWALDLPITTMEVKELIWLIDYPIWASNPPDKIFDLKPVEVLQNLDLFPKVKTKILNADCSFPIHIMNWREHWVILDGFHRLLKKIIANELEISVKKVPISAIYEIQPDRSSPNGFLKYETQKNLNKSIKLLE